MNDGIFAVINFDGFVCETLDYDTAALDVENYIVARSNARFHETFHNNNFIKRAVEVRDNVVAVSVVIKEFILACAAKERVVAVAAPKGIVATAAFECVGACAARK